VVIWCARHPAKPSRRKFKNEGLAILSSLSFTMPFFRRGRLSSLNSLSLSLSLSRLLYLGRLRKRLRWDDEGDSKFRIWASLETARVDRLQNREASLVSRAILLGDIAAAQDDGMMVERTSRTSCTPVKSRFFGIFLQPSCGKKIGSFESAVDAAFDVICWRNRSPLHPRAKPASDGHNFARSPLLSPRTPLSLNGSQGIWLRFFSRNRNRRISEISCDFRAKTPTYH